MRQIRDAGGRTCVVLIDHTGLADTTRGRGSNAVVAAMDTEIRVTKERRGVATVYTAEVTRDKAAPESDPATFGFTLWPVDVERPEGVAAPPVVVTGDAADRPLPEPTPDERQWYEIPLSELPDPLLDLRGPGKDAARDIYRVLLRIEHPDGSPLTDINGVLAEAAKQKIKGVRAHSRNSIVNGWARLRESGLIVQGSTAARWAAKT